MTQFHSIINEKHKEDIELIKTMNDEIYEKI